MRLGICLPIGCAQIYLRPGKYIHEARTIFAVAYLEWAGSLVPNTEAV